MLSDAAAPVLTSITSSSTTMSKWPIYYFPFHIFFLLFLLRFYGILRWFFKVGVDSVLPFEGGSNELEMGSAKNRTASMRFFSNFQFTCYKVQRIPQESLKNPSRIPQGSPIIVNNESMRSSRAQFFDRHVDDWLTQTKLSNVIEHEMDIADYRVLNMGREKKMDIFIFFFQKRRVMETKAQRYFLVARSF